MKKAKILETIPGIGKCLVNKLISFLLELGNKDYNIKQLAAIVGIAPYSRDSGNKNGKRLLVVEEKYQEMLFIWQYYHQKEAFVI